MNIKHNYSILIVLRQLVEKFDKNPNIENIMNIKKVIANVSNLQDISKHLLISPSIHLNNDKLSKDTKLHFVNFIQFVVDKIHVDELNTFLNIYTILLAQIYSDSKFTQLIAGHEEFKESIIKCLMTLIDRAASNVTEQFYTRQYATKLAAGIHSCTLISKFEKAISLRYLAIDCMMHLLQIHDNTKKADIVLRNQIGDIAMLFLPGVTTSLYEVCTASETQHHTVTLIAIRALGRFLSLVMEDSTEDESFSDLISKSTEEVGQYTLNTTFKGSNEERIKQQLEQVKRTSEWYKFAADKLIVIFEKLKILTNHTHYKVRREFVDFVNEVLFSCTRNLRPCFDKLFEILIALSEDDSEEIVSATNDIIDALYDRSESANIKSLLDIGEENFYNLLTKLPRIMRMSDDSSQLIALKELTGYLKLLRNQRLSHVMMSNAHSNKLIIALGYVVELDCSNISLSNDITISYIDDTDHYKNWKEYKFIFSSVIEQKLQSICHILGKLESFQILADNIFIFIKQLPQYRKELILLLNWMMESNNNMTVSFYKEVIEQYTTPDFWYLPIEVSDDVTSSKAQSNVVQCCLLTEGLGIIAEKLQENYDPFLLKTLYIIIERAGHENSHLSLAGRQAANKIAKALNCKSVADLLQQNIDYISYYVTIKLRRVEINVNVLNVIKVVMENSTIDFLPSLNSIVDNIFLNIRNKSKKQNIILYLKVFYIFTVSIKRMTNNEDNKETTPKESKAEIKTSTATAIIEYFLEYARCKQDAMNFKDKTENVPINDDEIEEGMNKYQETEDKEPELPYYVNIIENITKNCLHYLPSKEVYISLLTMSVLNECLQILSKYENTLLPLVHETWDPLIERFQNDNPLIINRAWDLLQTLALVSKDFIRARTLKNILPSIDKFLTNSAKKSLKKDNSNFYEYTQVYKLQKNLLTELGKVCLHLSLSEEQLWTVINIADLYLSSLQYPKLQESCIILFKDIVRCNADVVWVKCLALWHSQVESIPVNNFEDWYKKINDYNVQNEYVDNLKTILSFIKEYETI